MLKKNDMILFFEKKLSKKSFINRHLFLGQKMTKILLSNNDKKTFLKIKVDFNVVFNHVMKEQKLFF